ncbi:hypothetical protein IKJ53_07930 [bacterium]|nr:hypothetical protein [bacterium]
MTECVGMNPVVVVQPQTKKSNTGKVIGGLAGSTVGALSAATYISQELAPANLRSKAVQELKVAMLDDVFLHNKSSQKNFIHNAMKSIKKNGCISTGLVVVATILGGLTIGGIADSITNAVRNKKAAKVMNSQIA